MLWQLQEAKNKFSQLVQTAKTSGPQTVTVRGEPTVVVMSLADYEYLKDAKPDVKKPTLVEFLLEGEPWDDELVDLINTRSKSPGRVIEF
jgi:prevent-host-death family protein